MTAGAKRDSKPSFGDVGGRIVDKGVINKHILFSMDKYSLCKWSQKYYT